MEYDYKIGLFKQVRLTSVLKSAEIFRSLIGRHPSSIVQQTTAMLRAHSNPDLHTKGLRAIYSERCYVMCEGIKQNLQNFSRTAGSGCTSFWLIGPEHSDAVIFAEPPQKQRVLIEPEHIFCHSGHRKALCIDFLVPGTKIKSRLRQIEEGQRFFRLWTLIRCA